VQLKVLPASTDAPWFDDGLQFTCTQCGNCCTGGPGYVWISRDEIQRLAEHLNLSPEETVEKYCRKINGRFSLKEVRSPTKHYDCIFLKEERVETTNGSVTQTRRICTVYPVRPLQCRTWPFWESNLQSQTAWNRAARHCHGMNQGKHFTRDTVEAIRDVKDSDALEQIRKHRP
jgi:Fe-S-cluster containining protein